MLIPTTRSPPSPAGATAAEPGAPATVAHRIRDRVSALAYALEVIRMTAGDERKIGACLDLAGRQLDALAHLANELDEPAPAGPVPGSDGPVDAAAPGAAPVEQPPPDAPGLTSP